MISSHKQGVDIIQTIYNENVCQNRDSNIL